MSVQQFWNLSQLQGVFTCPKCTNLCQNFLTETCKQRLKLPSVDYVVQNWALAIMLKALPLVHFWHVLLLKEQMMTYVRKTLKTLVLSVQNRLISSEICLKITTKSAVFLPVAFQPSLPRKFPRNSHEVGRFFHNFVPKNHGKFDFLFRDLSEALYIKKALLLQGAKPGPSD